MSYLLRLCISTTMSAAAVEGFTTKSRRRLLSGGDCSDTSTTGKSDVSDRRDQADESFRKVMYLSCWGLG
ncbi:hypothetical protein ACSQ67_023550 [Phaseolus vulgaris]